MADRSPAGGVVAYLYDAAGRDREIGLSAVEVASLGDSSLLWIDIERGGGSAIATAVSVLGLDGRIGRALTSSGPRRGVDNYGGYQHFALVPLGDGRDAPEEWQGRLDFVVGDNWLLTVHDGEIGFLSAFRDQDRADTQTGALSAAALATSLIDWHLEEYLRQSARIEGLLDELDDRIMQGPASDRHISRLVAIKRSLGRLRRRLIAERPVIYGLMRPDIAGTANTYGDDPYAQLGLRFERVLDELDHSRQLVFATYDLLDSRLGQTTNELVKALTFYTVLIGIVAAVAGLFGMNFDPKFFRSGATGFFLVLAGIALFAITAIGWARARRWL